MPKRELHGGRRQWHVVARAGFAKAFDTREDFGRRRFVVEGVAAGKDATVEDAARDHGDAVVLAEGQKIVGRASVEHAVSAGDEKAVGIGLSCEPAEHVSVIRADADRADDALVAQLLQGAERTGQRFGEVVVRVVHVRDVDAVEPEPLQALLE